MVFEAIKTTEINEGAPEKEKGLSLIRKKLDWQAFTKQVQIIFKPFDHFYQTITFELILK